MSRSTQYIGLNDYALDFVRGAGEKKPILLTEGMFQEEIWGYEYIFPSSEEDLSCKYEVYKERVQAVPWSSGPMIFTCLQRIMVKHSGKYNCGDYFTWMLDPTIENEYDSKTGRYYV